MLDLSVYRFAFAPVLAALVIAAFSLEPVPDPLDPGPVTAEFDSAAATATARTLARVAPDRTPGSEDDSAAADLVAERFGQISSGTVLEQEFSAEVDGDERALRNVILILPGESERAILVVAGRDTRTGTGALSSAAATGVLLQLAAELGVADRSRTLVVASTDGSTAGAAGAREVLEAIPEQNAVDAAVVIAQPGAPPSRPHLLTGTTTERSPSLQVAETADAMLEAQAQVDEEIPSPGAQLARLALPAGLGEQAVLIAAGIDAVGISSAGELPIPPSDDIVDRLEPGSIDRFGRSTLALVNALDSGSSPPVHGPDAYIRSSGNVLPGWAVALLALTLLVPPIALAVARLARDARRGLAVGAALGWAAAWTLPGIAVVAAISILAVIGLIPTPAFPFDPSTLSIGAWEVLCMLALTGVALLATRMRATRRVPRLPRATLGAAAGIAAVVCCLAVWLANPFLALVCAPLAHVLTMHGGRRSLPWGVVLAGALLAALPLALVVGHVAAGLDWGSSAPWQLVVLTGSRQVPLFDALGVAALVGVSAACVLAARSRFTPSDRSRVEYPGPP